MAQFKTQKFTFFAPRTVIFYQNTYILLPFYVKITFLVIVGLLFTLYFCIKNKPDNKLYYPQSARWVQSFPAKHNRGHRRLTRDALCCLSMIGYLFFQFSLQVAI